jgi:hypothetical protein
VLQQSLVLLLPFLAQYTAQWLALSSAEIQTAIPAQGAN